MNFKKLLTLLGIGLIPLSLTAWRRPLAVALSASVLAGCSTPLNGPEIVYKTRVVGIPSSLLQDCPRADLGSLRTNADLARTVLAQDEALASCNADKAAIRQLQAEGQAAIRALQAEGPAAIRALMPEDNPE